MEPGEAAYRLQTKETPDQLLPDYGVTDRRKFVKWLGKGLAVAVVFPQTALAAARAKLK